MTDLPTTPPHSQVIPAELVPESAGTVAFLSSQKRQGHWILPRLFRAVSLIGSVEIDLTTARVGPGVSRIEVRAIFGNIEILVPPGLRVECDGAGILANFESDTKGYPVASADAPLISIGGTAFMANVEVKVIDPNAPTMLQRIASAFKG